MLCSNRWEFRPPGSAPDMVMKAEVIQKFHWKIITDIVTENIDFWCDYIIIIIILPWKHNWGKMLLFTEILFCHDRIIFNDNIVTRLLLH